jgi:nicotinate-nucleotide adenylyltransferase
VAASVDGIDGIEGSRMEIDRGGPSYTADTLRDLAAEHPDAALFVIVGADVASQLHTWHHGEEVAARATIAVVDRPGAVADLAPPWRVERVVIPALDISSSTLRERAAAGLPLDGLVPAPAMRLLRARGLYARAR